MNAPNVNHLTYDPESGLLIRHYSKTRTDTIGEIVRKPDGGYLKITIGGKEYKQHQIAYYIMTGMWAKCIDHINGDTLDNRWCNLRSVSHRENMLNLQIHRDGFLCGAHFSKALKKWRSRINIDGKEISLGLFETREEAHAAFMHAKGLIDSNQQHLIVGKIKKTGPYPGVSFHKAIGKWSASIYNKLKKKMEYCGVYDTPEEAREVVRRKKMGDK